MFECPTEEFKFFLLPGDVVASVERMFAFICDHWPGAIYRPDSDFDAQGPLREVNVAALFKGTAHFCVVENLAAVDDLSDPNPENWRHFGLGCHPLSNIILEVEVSNERGLLDPKAQADPYFAEVCLPQCWLLIVDVPRNDTTPDWDRWSLQAVAQLRA